MLKGVSEGTSRTWAERAPFVAVYAAGATLTAVGMYSVAHACGWPWYLAWLHSLAADGLGIVAIRAAFHLRGGRRAYAVAVCLAGTGLSAAVQAMHLRTGAGLDGPPSPALLTAVGLWPAPAGLLGAHLHRLTKPAVSSAPAQAGHAEAGQEDTAHGATIPPVASTGREGQAAPPAPPARPVLSSVPDTRRTAPAEVSRTGGRTAVTALADTHQDTPPDTHPGHPAALSQDTQDTTVLDTSRTPGQGSAGHPDEVSQLLLSGLSVRQVARETGQPKGRVEAARSALVADGQLPARGRP